MEFLLRKMKFHKPRSLSRRILSAILFLSIYQLEESNSLVLSRNASGIVNDFQNVSDLSLINSTREGRRSVVSGGLFSIVSFDNVPCNADSGDIGTCYSARECTNLGGSAIGICAGNYGVCCVVTPTCGATVTTNNTYFVNPGNPSTSSGPLTCSVTINKLAGATELYLEFTNFQIMGPTLGDCKNDTFSVSGTGTKLSPICGNNTGQMLYFDISAVPGTFTLTFTLANTADARSWKIRIVQFKTGDACAAPAGCQMYFRTSPGIIESFNYDGGKGQLINNYCINICFRLTPGNCNIILMENEFMLGGTAPDMCTTGDYLMANGQKYCGDTLGNGMLQANQTTGSYISIEFCSGLDNADLNVGYNLNYAEVKCSG